MNSSMCTNNDVIELGETDLEWTVGSHTIELVFPSKSVNPESTYIVKCKPTDKSIKRSPKIRTNNKRVIIGNLEGDTKYEISVLRENCDSGDEVSCFTARIFTAKSACSSLLDHAMQDEIIPSIFHLKPVISQDEDDISIEYRRFAYNDSRKSQTSKRVLLLGGENTGKTTLVNVIANHFLGVQYADSFRISITGDCDTVKNGSSNVISCSIDPLETSKYRWNLNIINVRGFKPDAENKNIMKSLKTFLKKKSDPVDLICLVLKSTYRHTTDESKILQAIISAVYDMPNVKFAPLITFHSGGSPLVLKVLRDEAVPCYEDLVFCFNNAKFYQCENEDFDTWDERSKTVIRLLSHLDNQQTYIESSSKSDQPASQRNRIDLHTNSTSDSITIELKCIQKKIKIQYRRKAGEWNGVYAEEPKVVLDNLAADTLYEIRVIEVDDDGNEHRVAEIQEKTKLSKGAKYLKSSSRDSVDPLVNHLSTKTNNVPGAEVRTLDIDCTPKRAAEKTILLFGGRGSGKKRIVDAMINYILSVEFSDEFRFCLTETDNKLRSRKRRITVFRITPPSDSKLQYILNIVIVPGFEFRQLRENNRIVSNLRDFLYSGYVKHISFACIVVPATCRLTEDQRHIFTCITSILGRDVSFLVPLITFHDGGSHVALRTLQEAKVPCLDHLCFSLNNANLLKSNELLWIWKNRNDVLRNFFQEVLTTPNISVEITKKVLTSLDKIDAISHKEESIRNSLNDTNTEKQLRREIRQKEQSSSIVKKKIRKYSTSKNINCKRCEITCIHDCKRIWGWFWCVFTIIQAICLRFCGIGNILNCGCPCRLKEHVVENYRYVLHEIPSPQNIYDSKSDEMDIKAKQLLKEYQSLYVELKSEATYLKNNALQFNEHSLMSKMKRFLEKE